MKKARRRVAENAEDHYSVEKRATNFAPPRSWGCSFFGVRPFAEFWPLGAEAVESVVNSVADFSDDLRLVFGAFAKSNQDGGA